MKLWLKNLYEEEAKNHLETAKFEHLCALGAPTNEASTLHELNADEHRAFAKILYDMASEFKVIREV
jgi:hypothetical protein